MLLATLATSVRICNGAPSTEHSSTLNIYQDILTLVLLNPDIPCLCKQCWSRSVGFWRSQLIWICTVCHQVCEFIATIKIKKSDWLKMRSGHGILIYSAGQGLIEAFHKEVGSAPNYRSRGHKFESQSGHITFMKNRHEIIFKINLTLLLIQEGHSSVAGKVCTQSTG